MTERQHRLGRVDTSFHGDDTFDHLVGSWLRRSVSDIGSAREIEPIRCAPDVSWTLTTERPPHRPVEVPTVMFGGVCIWRRRDVLVAHAGEVSATIDLASGRGRVTAWPDAPTARWRAIHNVLRPLWSAALSRRGLHPLHASGATSGEHAIVIVGASGAGKSTLAARLVADGGAFLSDDVILVDEHTLELFGLGDQGRFVAEGAQADVDGKRAIDVGSADTGPFSTGLLVLLETTSEPTHSARVAPVEAMPVLLRSALRMLDPAADAARLRTLASLSTHVAAVRCWRGPDGLESSEVLSYLKS